MEIFNYISGSLQAWTDDSTTQQIAFLLLMSVSAFILCMALMLLVSWLFRPEKGRLRELGPERAAGGHTPGVFGRLLQSGGDKVMPTLSENRSRYQNMLISAGFRSSGALSVFYGIRLLVVFILPVAVMVVGGYIFRLPPAPVFLFTVGAILAALVLPPLVLEKMMKSRQNRLRRGLPDALDLLVVCTEAGLGLKPALQRVAIDLYVSHPDLADEFEMVNAQTRVGIDNKAALTDLADRTGLPEMRSLVGALSQSIRFGSSLTETLRIYSEELRDKRIQAAEASAATVGTKMLFPLILCIMPAFFVVVLGPPILGALRALQATGKY